MPDDLFATLESPLARAPRQPRMAMSPPAPEPPRATAQAAAPAMTDPQRQAMRTAAAMLCGHFRAEAALALRQSGPHGAAALDSLDAGAAPMAVRAIILQALAGEPVAKAGRHA